MANATLTNRITELTQREQQFCQLLAVAGESLSFSDLSKLYRSIDWPGQPKLSMTITEVKLVTQKLVKQGLMQPAPYSSMELQTELRSAALQVAIHAGTFEKISQAIQQTHPVRQRYGYRPDEARQLRDVRIAFFNGDATTYQALAKEIDRPESTAQWLDPFDSRIYDQLDPLLRQLYCADLLPKMILTGIGTANSIQLVEDLLNDSGNPTETKPCDEFLTAAVDLFFAAGRIDRLLELHERFGNTMPEISGFIALLIGDSAPAQAAFAQAIPLGKKSSDARTTAVDSLAGVFYALLLLSHNSSTDRAVASSLISKIAKLSNPRYGSLMPLFKQAISFQESPASPINFSKAIATQATSPLARLIGSYLWRWNLAADDVPLEMNGLVEAGCGYAEMHLAFLAADAAALGALTSHPQARGLDEKASLVHAKFKTTSLRDLAVPVAHWHQALSAIRQLTAGEKNVAAGVEVFADERMIWELQYSTKQSSLSVRPILQKRSGNVWTKGRPIALERIYERRRDAEFAFLSVQDQAICQALDCDSSRNHYGYSETTYYFDDRRLASAIVGHPRLFHEGEREHAISVTEQQPQLTVKRIGDQVEISLQPIPTKGAVESGFQIVKHDKHSIGLISFTKEQLKLHTILNGSLTVPASAERIVMESIEPLARLVAIQSDVEAGVSTAQTIAADASPHLHAVPYEDGLQLTFHVRPFGEEGPFFNVGAGAETVVAKIGNETVATRRNLAAEQKQLLSALANCPTIMEQLGSRKRDIGSETIYLPTAEESLQTMLELEASVSQNKLTVHWPRGRRFSIAGQVSGADFRLNIKRDRDWFAASGSLKIDAALSLDMMRLIELVKASPSRFVALDDGRFLALTETFRRHIETFAAFGERGDGTLRFPPIRAAAMQDLEENFAVKADKHWQNCLQKIREADEITVDVPSTLATELRDYQQEGFAWLARLSQWGAGACLADDMGLGKTIQMLALLLHRSSSGPALVVAPTSVAFNWKSEIERFAPTLKPHLFGPGDRAAALSDLGPRDVVICSYGLLHSEAEKLQSQQWATLVLDEAQAIKNTLTKRSEAAKGLTADFRAILTGTPMENHLGELWNLFQFINPGLLGSLESFNQRFALPIERDGCAETRRQLKKLIQPFILRRTKSQVLQELPSRTEITLQVELSIEEAAAYEALRQQAVARLAESDDAAPTHVKIFAELMRLRRFCCHPRLVTPELDLSSAKLALFSDTIDELLQGNHKVLVFSQFVDHLSVLRETLDRKGVSYQYLDGSTPANQRKTRVEAFQSGEGDVFLISLKAGGVGLNLTSADYVIHMDPWWNPAVEDQASDRAHRLGQQRPVTIYRLIARGTIEERIIELHASKRDLADSLLEGTDRSGKLSTKELLKLIQS